MKPAASPASSRPSIAAPRASTASGPSTTGGVDQSSAGEALAKQRIACELALEERGRIAEARRRRRRTAAPGRRWSARPAPARCRCSARAGCASRRRRTGSDGPTVGLGAERHSRSTRRWPTGAERSGDAPGRGRRRASSGGRRRRSSRARRSRVSPPVAADDDAANRSRGAALVAPSRDARRRPARTRSRRRSPAAATASRDRAGRSRGRNGPSGYRPSIVTPPSPVTTMPSTAQAARLDRRPRRRDGGGARASRDSRYRRRACRAGTSRGRRCARARRRRAQRSSRDRPGRPGADDQDIDMCHVTGYAFPSTRRCSWIRSRDSCRARPRRRQRVPDSG